MTITVHILWPGKCSCLCDWPSKLCCDWCNRELNLCTCYQKGLLFCDWKFKDKNSFACILSCCKSCSICRRVTAKERCKSRSSDVNKICERCFLCRSIVFCNMCHKCPNCCSRSTCRSQIDPVLGEMGNPRWQPQSPQRWLHSTLPVPTRFDLVTQCHKLLCKSPQEPLPVVGIASAFEQKCSRTSDNSNISGLLEPVISSSKTQHPLQTYTRPQYLKPVSKDSHSKWRPQRQ